MKENFPLIMHEVFKFEGGYVDHPRDPGGATNMGITRRTLEAWEGRRVTKLEVKDLSPQKAMAIYKKNYWNAVRGDDLASGFDMVAMDGAVNSGPSRGIRWLQRAVRATVDGAVGPQTIAATRAAGVPAIERACAYRVGFLRGLSTFGVFGRGWLRRVAHVESVATMLALPDSRKKAVAREKMVEAGDRKQASKQGAVAQTGGGGALTVLADNPWLLALIIMVTLLGAIWLYNRMRYQRERETAFKERLEVLQ